MEIPGSGSGWIVAIADGVTAETQARHFVGRPAGGPPDPGTSQELGISEEDVIKKVMLKETVDGEFTTIDDVAEVALLFAAFPSNALTGQSLVVSHGWFMQ